MCVEKTKSLISCAVTAQLICIFGFAYADCWFSDAAAQLQLSFTNIADLSRLQRAEKQICERLIFGSLKDNNVL